LDLIYLRSAEEAPALALQENAIKDYLCVEGREPGRTRVDMTPMGVALDERDDFRDLIHSLRPGDRIYVYDLSVISRQIGELVQFFNCLFEHGLELVVVQYGIRIDRHTPAYVVVRLLNAMREENRRSRLGRPKGSISRSKFDAHRERIIEMIRQGRSVSEIAKALDASRSSVRDYIVSRNLKKIALGDEIEAKQLPKGCNIDERNDNGDSDNR
jgi:DNA invertase Pin-like site-specific DNA recombinase